MVRRVYIVQTYRRDYVHDAAIQAGMYSTWCCCKGKYVNGADLQEKYVLGAGMQAEVCSYRYTDRRCTLYMFQVYMRKSICASCRYTDKIICTLNMIQTGESVYCTLVITT
jgi:hypothetical protein